eukprot:3939171-Rhodomonas_salina.1
MLPLPLLSLSSLHICEQNESETLAVQASSTGDEVESGKNENVDDGNSDDVGSAVVLDEEVGDDDVGSAVVLDEEVGAPV